MLKQNKSTKNKQEIPEFRDLSTSKKKQVLSPREVEAIMKENQWITFTELREALSENKKALLKKTHRKIKKVKSA